jgi:hypothetical protein
MKDEYLPNKPVMEKIISVIRFVLFYGGQLLAHLSGIHILDSRLRCGWL